MSITVSAAGAAATLVYCTVHVVCYMWPEEFASYLIIHSALPGCFDIGDSVPRLAVAVIAVSVLLFLSRRRWSIDGRVAHAGRCGILCYAAPFVMSSYNSMCLLLYRV